MKHLRKNGGFTLVELMVTIVVGTLITAAAVTVLLLGLRVNKQSTDTVSRQYTTRILLSALEDLATEGEITGIVSEPDGWKICGKSGEGSEIVYFSYNKKEQKIYASGTTSLLEGVISSYVERDLESGLLTFSVETEDGIYNSSVYCRLGAGTISGSTDSGNDLDETTQEEAGSTIGKVEEGKTTDNTARALFLKVLASQYGSTGCIKGSTNTYSLWYCGGAYWEGWNKDTPWCACYVSWALAQSSVSSNLSSVPKYANVDDFLAYFVKAGAWKNAEYYTDKENGETVFEPTPGDLIFFDWKVNAEANPEHVGVVLYVDDAKEFVYTIEGNTAGMVAVRKYALDDARILGYGVLNWKTETTGTT